MGSKQRRRRRLHRHSCALVRGPRRDDISLLHSTSRHHIRLLALTRLISVAQPRAEQSRARHEALMSTLRSACKFTKILLYKASSNISWWKGSIGLELLCPSTLNVLYPLIRLALPIGHGYESTASQSLQLARYWQKSCSLSRACCRLKDLAAGAAGAAPPGHAWSKTRKHKITRYKILVRPAWVVTSN